MPVFNERCKKLGIRPELHLEPGRYIVADTTVLLMHVNTVKRRPPISWARTPASTRSSGRRCTTPTTRRSSRTRPTRRLPDTYTVVGPVCESGDILATDRQLPAVRKGDIVALLDAGAYGFCMSSQYLGRPRAAEVLVHGGQAELIRRRETYDDLLQNQMIPGRLL